MVLIELNQRRLHLGFVSGFSYMWICALMRARLTPVHPGMFFLICIPH